MKIRLVARKPHYRDHLLPIWNQLPEEAKLRGEPTRFDLLLVAGASDRRHGNPYVLVEHGVGFSWQGIDNPSYSGGSSHNDCELFICPNDTVGDRWRSRYPDARIAVVGCPRLDAYHDHVPPERTVAITFHWDCRLCPETRSAWPHYQPGIRKMVQAYREQGWAVLGHAHPRYRNVLRPVWERLGVKWTDDPLRDASVLIADATSLMAEMHALGRPVLALNAPWYRRDVHHGMRFWEWPLRAVDGPQEASQVSLDSLTVPADWKPYAYNDGKASTRAAEAVLSLLADR
jgi:hypothetical protein